MDNIKQYSGRYFDGFSTRAIPVKVLIQASTIVIMQELWDHPRRWEVKNLLSLEKQQSKLILRAGTIAQLEILEVSSEDFIRELKAIPQLAKINAPSSPVKYIFASFAFLVICGIALIYFFVFPWLIDKAIAVFPRDVEVKMGKSMLDGFLANETIDVRGSELLNKFYKESGIKPPIPFI